jgi:hypothetical protein
MTEATDPNEANAPKVYRKTRASDVFAIDRRAWAKVCSLGLNPSVTYLVMARGSGPDQRTVRWSVNAVEKRTGISRPRVKAAVAALIQTGCVRLVKGGKRPAYYLTPAHQIRGCEGASPDLHGDEFEVYGTIALKGSMWVPQTNNKHREDWGDVGRPCDVALRLAKQGWLKSLGNQWFEAVSYDEETASRPDWIWLPNAIVDGAADETAPLELVRQSHDAIALRLFIDLYHAHNLLTEGGVTWRRGKGLRVEYKRNKVQERGEYIVWGFEKSKMTAWAAAAFIAPHLTGQNETVYVNGQPVEQDSGLRLFWAAFKVLQGCGLIDMVPHLIEADTDDGEVIHSLGSERSEPVEREVGSTALFAADDMLEDFQRARLEMEDHWQLVPVARHLANVQLVGIGRLTYRPQTEATALWLADLKARSLEWVRVYEARRNKANGRAAGPVQYQG